MVSILQLRNTNRYSWCPNKRCQMCHIFSKYPTFTFAGLHLRVFTSWYGDLEVWVFLWRLTKEVCWWIRAWGSSLSCFRPLKMTNILKQTGATRLELRYNVFRIANLCWKPLHLLCKIFGIYSMTIWLKILPQWFWNLNKQCFYSWNAWCDPEGCCTDFRINMSGRTQSFCDVPFFPIHLCWSPKAWEILRGLHPQS